MSADDHGAVTDPRITDTQILQSHHPEGIRPGRTREDVLALVTRIGQAFGQGPLRPW